MHNSEFEKRMEHKLEELKFTPSDAVWQKVEVQIRERKRRRRFFFWWLPAIVLCTGVGAWFIYSTEKGKTKTSATVTTTQRTESSPIKDNQTKRTETVPENIPVVEEKSKQPVFEKNIQKKQEVAVLVKTKRDVPVVDGLTVKENKKIADKQNVQLIVKEEKPIVAEIKNPDAVNHVEVNVPLPEEKKNSVVTVTKENEQIKTENPVISEKPVLTGNPVVIAESIVSEKIIVKDSAAISPVKEPVIATKPLLSGKKKFEAALVFRGGVADMSQFSEGLNKSGRLYASPGSAGSGSGSGGYSSSASDSAKVKNGVGFTAGIQLKKSMTKRSALSIGLGYGYYSSSHKTSGIVYADAQFSNNLGTSVVNNYARVGNSSTYKDRYHFIEIPVLYHLQVTKAEKRPILFNGGIAYSYLVGSNAQYYYSATKTYYYDRSLFNRSQLQVRTGISFGLVKKMNYPLQLGLQYQYGLSGQWKKSLDLNQHLSFTGIQLLWRLNKK